MLNKFAFLAITETCISETTKHCFDLIAGRKYSLFHVFRTNSRGGGITLFLKNKFKAKVNNSSFSPHFEFLSLGITFYRKTFLIIVYRPPPGSITSFFEQFSYQVSKYLPQYFNCFILGDFNIPLDKNGSIQLKFNSLLEEFGLFCGPSEATSVNGNILDLVITNREISVDIVLDKSLPSDHFALLFDFEIERPVKETKNRMGYPWKSVNDYEYAEIFNNVS